MSSIDPAEVHVLYRDDHFIAVDKPPGIPVQPDRTGDRCLLQAVQAMLPELSLGSPHRLDRPVGGITLFTLTPEALRAMDAFLREKRVEKTYLAIVEGQPAERGELLHRLIHLGGTRKATVAETRSGEAGNAVLRYTTRATGERYTLLEVVPEGGAFHQIRGQLAEVGHPIKGDVKYGARRGERDRSIALHAWRMAFPHPFTGKPVQVVAPVPVRSIWPALVGLVPGGL